MRPSDESRVEKHACNFDAAPRRDATPLLLGCTATRRSRSSRARRQEDRMIQLFSSLFEWTYHPRKESRLGRRVGLSRRKSVTQSVCPSQREPRRSRPLVVPVDAAPSSAQLSVRALTSLIASASDNRTGPLQCQLHIAQFHPHRTRAKTV